MIEAAHAAAAQPAAGVHSEAVEVTISRGHPGTCSTTGSAQLSIVAVFFQGRLWKHACVHLLFLNHSFCIWAWTWHACSGAGAGLTLIFSTLAVQCVLLGNLEEGTERRPHFVINACAFLATLVQFLYGLGWRAEPSGLPGEAQPNDFPLAKSMDAALSIYMVIALLLALVMTFGEEEPRPLERSSASQTVTLVSPPAVVQLRPQSQPPAATRHGHPWAPGDTTGASLTQQGDANEVELDATVRPRVQREGRRRRKPVRLKPASRNKQRADLMAKSYEDREIAWAVAKTADARLQKERAREAEQKLRLLVAIHLLSRARGLQPEHAVQIASYLKSAPPRAKDSKPASRPQHRMRMPSGNIDAGPWEAVLIVASGRFRHSR